ncbi:hypothetical protein SAMN05216359_1228 [Roseateles sp. YR242]|uniref:hypothetical protein n=1 Tax=Roseateles sp. YR242 TaxID=1855305 RepID=UPI0008CB47D8|nr:hypothetical protein [Roseateles sp. YR242]SEL89141.1 hypothetical protein SAMN05216359_1228 [Roseateles sp. YR242]
MATIEELGRKMLGTLNDILTGGDGKVPAPVNNKISWCQPGIPFMPEDFQFAAEGIASIADAEHLKKMQKQAFNFSLAVDFVPDVSGIYAGDRQQTIYRTSEARMSHMYGEILKFSKVVQSELSADEKAKIEKFRGLLYATKTTKNLVNDEEKTFSEPGPVLVAYNSTMSNYIDAATNYQNKRIQAQVATGPGGAAAVADFQYNAENYYLKVKAALNQWVSEGYRNEVDEMHAYIDHVTQRSMTLWKQQLLELYDRGTLTDADSNSPFKYTTIIPGAFATSNGWTGYSFSHEQANSSSNWRTSSWSGGGGLNLGLWRASGGANGNTESSQNSLNVNNFKISFELVQAVIARPWFYPEFFMNRGWTLRKGEGWNFEEYPSDGAAVPKGTFIGYPTQAIFIRNLVIESDEFATAFAQHASSVSGGGSVGWGPFSIHGNYSHASGSQSYSMDRQGGRIVVPGMQIIAFINHLIPTAPNPLPDIPAEQFQ